MNEMSWKCSNCGYVLQATLGTVETTSAEFAIQPAAAAQLAFISQPASGVKRATIAPPFEVEIQDGFGNRVTTGTHQITVGLADNPGRMEELGYIYSMNRCLGLNVDWVTPDEMKKREAEFLKQMSQG